MPPLLPFYYLYQTNPQKIMELLSYFYHPDHLGSSSWITDGSGNAIQHLQNLPFGEDWVDERSTTWNSRYTFTGKEKDTETGYHYFGARYYDSGLSIWLSVDPMSDKYPSMSPYNYCANNPIILVDPDGREIEGMDWKPDGKGGWTAEAGDSPGSLARDANISQAEAEAAVRTANQQRGQPRTSETMVYQGDHVVIPSQQTTTSSNNSTPEYQLPIPTGGRIESVSPIGVLIDLCITQPIQYGLEYAGMGENSAYWTSNGITILGSLLLAKRISGGKGSNWSYGTAKSEAKWISQFSKRGWTPKQVTEAITKGKSFDAINKVNPANGATRFVHPKTGQSVVIDNATRELLHVGGPGFKY